MCRLARLKVMSVSRIVPALMVLCAAMNADAQDRARNQSFDVFEAVLDSLYRSHGDRPSIVIVTDSLYWRQGGVAYGGKILRPHTAQIDTSAISDFERVTAKAIPFPRAFRYRGNFHVFSTTEYEQLHTRGNSIASVIPPRELRENPYWLGFLDRYPNAWGVTVLSRAGFSRDSTQALIYVRHQCGGGCFSSETIFLRKEKSRWKIAERIADDGRESLGSGKMRYLGPGARFLADLRRQEDSTRRAVADSIRRDRAPRRLRGTISSAQTGLPIQYAQLFVHTSRFPGEKIARVVADSRGRYVVRNPSMGGTMLEVQCPGKSRRNGRTLGAPGTYVFPAMDTVIDIRVPNIEPCWTGRRARPLIGGELTSTAYRPSPFPTATDVAVYSALVAGLNLRDSAAIVSETRHWCGGSYGCPTFHVAHLERAGILDSSTLGNFKAVAADSVPLNPAAMAAIGVPLLSNGERIYLTQESKRVLFDSEEHREFWAGLRATHKGAARIVSLTRPGYNVNTDRAIVSYKVESAEDETAEVVLLEKQQARWRILRRHLEDEPISAELVGGKCLPTLPGDRPTDEQLANIAGEFDFTLISSATDNGVSRRRVSVKKGDVRFDIHSRAGEIRFGSSLLIRAVSSDHLFGQWIEHYGGHVIPIGRDGRPRPFPAGHFCATRIEQ